MSKENNSIFSGRITNVDYMCVYCGRRVVRSIKTGRPLAGICTARKLPNGRPLPHRWVVNKRY